MKKNLLIIALLLIIVGYVLFKAFVEFMDSYDYSMIDRQISPDGKYELVQYLSGAETGHAPYGSYLVISPSTGTTRLKDGHVIFSGYCKTTLSYQWVNNTEIHIFCADGGAADIRALSSKAFGKDIAFKTR